jgi:hypothetical protein
MILKLISYNGHNINDGTNYTAYPIQSSILANSTALFSQRAGNWPVLSGKTFDGKLLPVVIYLQGTLASQREEIMAWFNHLDQTPYKLLAADLANSSKQWYVMGTPAGQPVFEKKKLTVMLALTEPYWMSEVEDVTAWTLTSTAGTWTKTIQALGNAQPLIKFEITPTSARGSGYAYRVWRPIYNPTSTSMPNYAFDLGEDSSGVVAWNTAALVADTTRSNQINKVGGITAGDTSIPIDTAVGGGLPTGGGVCIVGSEQIRYSLISGGTMTVATGGRGWGGSTAATHADNAVIKMSKALKNADDVRVRMNGKGANYWLSGWNTTTTRCFVNVSLAPKIEMTLSGAIASSGAVATINLKKTAANKALLGRMPVKWTVMIDDECWTGNGKNVAAYKLTGGVRAQNGTSMASHADGATVRWIQNSCWILYGDPDANAPVINDLVKPMIDIATSTNRSHVYSTFSDEGAARTMAWKKAVLASLGKKSTYYTGSHTADADPATEAGMSLLAYQVAGAWRAETGTVVWSLYNPAGVTNVVISGDKRRLKTSWPATAALQKSANGTTWSNIWNEASPASIAWTAWSHTDALGATYQHLRLILSGNISAAANNEVNLEAQTVTATLDSARVPNIAQAITELSAYYIDSDLTNTTNGNIMSIAWPWYVNRTLTIACDTKTASEDAGLSANSAVTLVPDRAEWMPMEANTTAAPVTTTFTWTETGVFGMTILVKIRHRVTA